MLYNGVHNSTWSIMSTVHDADNEGFEGGEVRGGDGGKEGAWEGRVVL